MYAELIECPACKHALRVPETLFGFTVRCPECRAHFTAPKRDAEGKLGKPVLVPRTPAPNPQASNRLTDSPFFMPATLLILVSTIGVVVHGYQTMIWHTDRERAERAVSWLIEQYANLSRQELSPEQLQTANEIGMIGHHVVFCMNVVSLAGGIAILFHRFRWLGIIGSVLAMLNISNCCCALGLPAGGYCIIKLIDPDLAGLFQR